MKKLIYIGAGIVAFIILVVIILLVYHSINKKTSYDNVENELVNAAKKYYSDHEELLPKDNNVASVDDITLTSGGYLKSMSDLTSKLNATCSGRVEVNYLNNDYRYVAILDCGDSYKTNLFYDYITTNEKVVYSGSGLYELNGELVFRGDTPNNNVLIGNKKFRIVKIDSNKDIVLLYDDKLYRSVWDNRYNIEKESDDGINEYSISRIYTYLMQLFDKNEIIAEKDKSLLKSFSVEIGKRNIDDTINDGSLEKALYVENQMVGLLPAYDVINASLDTNCQSIDNESCTNYNYLRYYDYVWWLATTPSDTTRLCYNVDTAVISDSRCSSESHIRPVVHLNNNVLYSAGDGSEENPYIIK